MSTFMQGFMMEYAPVPPTSYDFTFPDGQTVTLYYDAEKHMYYRHGKEDLLDPNNKVIEIPGVTSVCGGHISDKSGALSQWAANETTNYLREKIKPFALTGSISGQVKYVVSPDDFEKLLQEARFNYKEISKTALDVGHIAHEWLEHFAIAQIEGKFFDPTRLPEVEQAKNCVNSALGWHEKHHVKMLNAECKIYSRRYDFAGTMDGDCLFTPCNDDKCKACIPYRGMVDVLAILDYKSSKAHYIEYRVQKAAYLEARHEQTGVRPVLRITVRLGKDDGSLDTKIYGPESQIADFQAFFNALQNFKYVKDVQNYERAKKQAEKDAVRALKEEAARVKKEEKCGWADRYKGKSKPRCNNGKGCKACNTIYAEAHGLCFDVATGLFGSKEADAESSTTDSV